MGLRALGAALGLVAGCGPIEYMSQVSGRAATALADAKRAGGEQFAPYEFTAATEYLRKAREEAGHSAYQVAIEYGREAEEMATRAEAIARERSTKGSAARPPEPPPPPPTETR
jgi:hypothetical protein